MEDVTFRIVEVDGTLADIRPVFNNLATAVLARPVEVGDVEPPHTITCLSHAAGLSNDERAEVRRTIHEITDFWASVPARVIPSPGPDLLASAVRKVWPPIFHARRIQTRGRPVLLQTIEWLIKRGYENPIVWIEED